LSILKPEETKMTDRRIRCITVLTFGFGISILASNQAFPESAAEKNLRIQATNERKKADAAAKKAKVTIRAWHFGDPLPTDDFGGGFTLQKNYDPDRRERAAISNAQPSEVASYEYLKQQVLELKRGQRPGGFSKPAVERRQQAVDNLKALGPEASDAVPALTWSAMNERDAYVKQGAIEILGEIGGMLGVVAVSGTFLKPDEAPEIAKAAETALLKLLPAVGSSLTMNDAIFLLKVHDSGNELVSRAIESAWEARGFTQAAIAQEIQRQILAERARANAKAKVPVAIATEEVALSDVQELCLKILRPGIDPETAKTAEDSLLKLLPTVGRGLTPRDAFFLDDVRHMGNKRLSSAVETAWEAGGFKQFFAAKEKFEREHPGQEEADAEAYAASHGGKKKLRVREMPEHWQRWWMTPNAPPPNYVDMFNRAPAGSGETNAQRRAAEIDRQNRERAANRVR
jgi:hypothetical protein